MKKKNSSSILNRVRWTRGANMVEYVILVGMIALIAVIAFKTFGDNVKDRTGKQAESVQKINSDGL